MGEVTDGIGLLALVFAIVFVLNVMPAFAPPTWMTLAFAGLTTETASAVGLALTGAVAATLGRISLAQLSHRILRAHLLSDATLQNVETVKVAIETRKRASVGGFLAFSLSPLPSNYLFIAYGLTALPILLLAAPFLVGRFASYLFWVASAAKLSDHIDVKAQAASGYFWLYFIGSQLLLVPTMYVFVRLDWQALLAERRLRWLER